MEPEENITIDPEMEEIVIEKEQIDDYFTEQERFIKDLKILLVMLGAVLLITLPTFIMELFGLGTPVQWDLFVIIVSLGLSIIFVIKTVKMLTHYNIKKNGEKL